MSDIAPELDKHVLRPSPEEIRGLRILFYSQQAATFDTSDAPELYWSAVVRHLRELGAIVTLTSDPEDFLRPLEYDFVWCSQLPSTFDGHELLLPNLTAFRHVPCLGASAPIRALSVE